MMGERPESTIIRIAAKLANGGYLQRLWNAIETQKTMRSSVLDWHTEEMHERMKQDAIALKLAVDELNRRALGSAAGRES